MSARLGFGVVGARRCAALRGSGVKGALENIGGLHESLAMLKDKGKREVVEGAMNMLKHWKDVKSTGNQEVMLSLALEAIKYTPSDKDFFQKNKYKWTHNIIEENRTALFDSHQMIGDWWAEQNCSNYEERCRLQRAANDLKGRTGDLGLLSRPKSRFIYEAELVDMALDLIMEDIRPFADSLGIERTKFTSYRKEFRASHLDRGTINLVLQLCKMIEIISVRTMRPDVHSILENAGYPNVSKRFMSATEPSYGELFAIATAVHLDDKPEDGAGTPESSGESKQAKESTNETVVITGLGSSSNANEKAGAFHTRHQKAPRLDATLTSINIEETKINDDDGEVIDTEGSRHPLKPIGDTKNKSKHAKSNTDGYRQRVSDVQQMLELTDEDIPDSNMASILTLFKIWKERVCPGLLDHRVVLAEGLQNIMKIHLVAEVISGQYQSRKTSTAFIEDMLDRMDGSRQTSLERLLKSKEHWIRGLKSSHMTSQWICDWVPDWTKEMESSIKNKLMDVVSFTKASERHRDFNDKLVDNGFLDLAREIMNIEQVL